MTNISSPEGFLSVVLLFICSCAYIRRVPRLRSWFLTEKRGPWGIFYKASVIGSRLHWVVSFSCLMTALYIIVFK
ncbi:unnamed protein product [Heterosigma akashiwo]